MYEDWDFPPPFESSSVLYIRILFHVGINDARIYNKYFKSPTFDVKKTPSYVECNYIYLYSKIFEYHC